MVEFNVKILPPPFAIAKTFAGVALEIQSFREPMKRSIQGVVGPAIRDQFDAGGDPKWAELRETTIANKENLGYRQPEAPLIATGKLRKVAGQLNVWNISRTSAEAVNLPGAEYGQWHMTGTRAPHNMPARPFLSISDDNMDEIQQVFAFWLGERFARRRFRVR